MSENNTIRRSADQLKTGDSDWKRVEALSDAQIEAAISGDPDAAPLLDDAWFRGAELVTPAKVPTSIRVDSDVRDWFRSRGRGWQTRMNAVLRAYARAHGGVK
ncbi:MAG TPA: BrnA antitoxin family protein [Caulobacteraceae bacterium]|nr:BrnA antitoxin family protein [Caulobacteraceae bacterium]